MTTSAESKKCADPAVESAPTVIEALRRLAADYPEKAIPLGDAVHRMGDRAFGLLMLMLALPMATPISAVPGVSTVVGVPLLVVCIQFAVGMKEPRLPDALARRCIDRDGLRRILKKADRWLERIERLTHPRWPALTGRIAERIIGIVCAVMTLIVALPIPGGNQPPALAVTLFAVAVSERDGLFAILGAVVTVLALAFLAVLYGLIAGAGIMIFQKATG